MSWLFNLGLTPAVRRSTLLRKLNAGDYEGAAEEFPKWRKSAGQVLPGLVKPKGGRKENIFKGMNMVNALVSGLVGGCCLYYLQRID